MATKWRLAKSLEQLRKQINAASPNRNKASDGTIGDAAHASRSSDHNPWIKDSKGMGVVSAMDITSDHANGVDGGILSRALKTDPRVKYLIFESQIWKARTGTWEPYRGPNPHDKHLHISVKPESIDDVSEWPWPVSTPFTTAAANMGGAAFLTPQVEPVTAEDAAKGVTTGVPADADKPVESGTPPPAQAVEVKASRPSLKSTAASIITFILGPLAYFGIDVKDVGQAGAQFAANNVGLAIKVAVGFGFIVVAAYIWNRAMDRAQERTNRLMDSASDKDRNNLRLVGGKDPVAPEAGR